MKKIIRIIWLLGVFVFALSCNEDDLTGDSTMIPSSPTLSVSLDFDDNTTLIESETEYSFTVNLSEPQVADVVVYLTQIDGSATDGADFSFPHTMRIPAGSTSLSNVITIHADEEVEATENAVIKIGTGLESNVQKTNSQTVSFNIQNVTSDDLVIGLEWEAAVTVTDNFGNEIGPTDLADLRLLITNVPYTAIIDGADGASFETYSLTGDSTDGEYYVVADFYAAEDISSDLNLTATFNQTGTINALTYNFPAALSTNNSCSSVHYILAKITKTGSNYEIESVGENSPVTASSFIGTSTVVTDEWEDYSPGDSVEIEAGTNEYEFLIRAYSNPAIANPNTAYLVVTIDPLTGNVTVVSNEDFDYGCSEGDVTGTGSVNACEGTIDLVLDFGLGNCGDYPGYALTLQL